MVGHNENCASFTGDEVSGNIFIRKVHFEKKGDYLDGHKHVFDHTTIFLEGTFHVHTKEPGGVENDYDVVAPNYMLIKKDVEHLITTTSKGGGKFWCVYSHRDANGGVVQEFSHKLQDYS